MEWATEKALNTPIIPGVMRKILGAPTGKLKSVFITAEDRLARRMGVPSIAAKMLRKRERQTNLSRQLSERINLIHNDMTMPERKVLIDTLKRGVTDVEKMTGDVGTEGYWRLPLEGRKRLREVFNEIEAWKNLGTETGSIEELRKIRITEGLQNAFEKEILSKDGILPTKEFGELLGELKAMGQDSLTGRRLDKALKSIWKNPAYSQEMKDLARDMQSTGGYTLEAFPKMALNTEEVVLMQKVSRLPWMVSEREAPGFIRQTEGQFKGLWLDEDLNDALLGLKHVQGDSLRLFNRLFLSPWKLGKVVLRIPGQFRNVISNIIQNDWGGLPFYRQDIYMKALKEIHKGKNSAILNEFRNATGVATTFADVETQYLPAALKHSATYLDVFEHFATHRIWPVQKMIKLYQMVETTSKLAKFIHNRTEKGMLTAEAAEDAIKWTFNYGEVTPAVKLARGTIAPFATWTAKIFPLFFETAKQHPWRLSKWALMPSIITHQAMKNLNMSEEEWDEIKKTMPDWQKNGWYFMVPWRDEKDRLQMINLTWLIPGLGDLSDFNAEGVLSLRSVVGNPIITGIGDIMNNKTFSGAPIYNDWDDPSMKFLKTSWHIHKQITPSFMGDFWSRAYKTAIDKPGAQTTMQQAIGMFGTKVQPIDQDHNEMMFYRGKKREHREILSKMKKIPYGAMPDKYTDRLSDYYIKRLENLYEEESGIKDPLSPLPGIIADPLDAIFR